MPPAATGNLLLDALLRVPRTRLAGRPELVALAHADPVFEPGGPVPHVYFPLDGIVSLVAVMAGGARVEVLTVGREGLVGMPAVWGTGSLPLRAFCQVPGAAYRVEGGALRDELDRGGEALALLLRYTQAVFHQVARGAACNRAHPLARRCARWLLMTHDRVGRDDFELKQEFLAEMLGVRRAGVSEAAGALQAAGHIRYARGKISVVNRAGLEAAACECHRVVEDEYRRLLGGPTPPAGGRAGKRPRRPVTGG